MTASKDDQEMPATGKADADVPSIQSHTGSTRQGMPLALNRAPGEDLGDWIMRIGVTSVDMPEGASIECMSLCEHPVIRMIYGAKWTAWTADGKMEYEPGDKGLALYFGPETKAMNLRVDGSFRVVSINCTSAFATNFGLPDPRDTLDRILPLDPLSGLQKISPGHHPQDDPHAWLDASEAALRDSLQAAAPDRPHDLLDEFERLTLTNPTASLSDFACDHEVTPRTLERTISRNWGVTPKFALRRARALDMAAALLGVADATEEPELRLRYFDQSHMTREMRHFFDHTPGAMQTGECPLLRITMEIRQSRRLEAIAKLAGSERPSWRDPSAEPGSD